MTKQSLRQALIIPFALVSLAFGEPRNSKLELEQFPIKDNKIVFQFKVTALNGRHITDEAPWELALTRTEGLDLSPKDGKVSFKDYDAKIPGFRISVSPLAKVTKGEFTYQLKSFICEDDKTRCYAEVHKGSLPWSTLPKK